MKILECFYKRDSGGFTELVEHEGQFYVGWRVSDAIESDEFNYAFWTFQTLEEALEKFEELREEEMSWR